MSCNGFSGVHGIGQVGRQFLDVVPSSMGQEADVKLSFGVIFCVGICGAGFTWNHKEIFLQLHPTKESLPAQSQVPSHHPSGIWDWNVKMSR